jgi:hypothetical protein
MSRLHPPLGSCVCVRGGCLLGLGVTFVVAEEEEALTLRAGDAVDVF